MPYGRCHRRSSAQVLRSLPPKELLGVLSEEQIREYLDRLTTHRPTTKPRRKN